TTNRPWERAPGWVSESGICELTNLRIDEFIGGLQGGVAGAPCLQFVNPSIRQFVNPRAHRGMFPCFLGGFLSRFVSSVARAVINFARVSRGRMISSIKPRSAAM